MKQGRQAAQDQDSKIEVVMTLIQKLNIVQNEIEKWKTPSSQIDSLCQESKVVVKDQNGSSVTTKHLITNMEGELKDVVSTLKKREETVTSQRNQFVDLQKQLSTALNKTHDDLVDILKNVKTGQTIQPAIEKVQALLKRHEESLPAKKKIHEGGVILMKQDQSSLEPVQKFLTSLDSKWDNTEEILKVQHKRLSDMLPAWESLIEIRNKFKTDLNEIKTGLNGDDKLSELNERNIKLDLANARSALDQLKKLKNNFNVMTNKAQFILKQTENMENYDEKELESLLKSAQDEWKDVCDEAVKKIQDSDAQNILWEHMEDEKNEIMNWLKQTLSSLNASLKSPDQIQSKLAKYNDDLPTYLNLKSNLTSKIEQLIKASPNKNVQFLKETQKNLEDEFESLQTTVKNLQDMALSFGDQEQAVRIEVKNAGELITQIREAIIACDDLTGDTNRILERLNKVQVHQKDLEGFKNVLKQVNTTLTKMKKEFPSFGDSNLVKELERLEKRYEGVVSHANKVENNLRGYLTKQCNEKFSNFEKLLGNLTEKLNWCIPEENSDRYNLSLKLSSLKDVETGLEECENKKPDLNQSLMLLEKVENKEYINNLEAQKKKLVEEVEALKKNSVEVGEKLKRGVGLWEKYDLMSENISSWLKENEAKIRSESYNQVEISEIPQKIKEAEEFQRKITQIEPEIKHLTELAETISKENPDSRTKQHCNHLATRYNTIVKFIDSYLERLENLRKNQKLYNDALDNMKQWLKESDEKLKKIEGDLQKTPKSLSGFQKQVDELKEYEKTKEKGQTLLNSAVEKGEVLFMGILPENRETMRTELRALRDSAEGLLDRANNISKRIETMIMKRSSIDESYSQVERWLDEVRKKVEASYEPKATLQEKKLALHGYRTLHQDITAHKNMIAQLQEKISSLSDDESNKKLNSMLKEYDELMSSIESKIKQAEIDVLNHEKFLTSLEKFHDWLETLKAEAAPVVFGLDAEKESAIVRLEFLENLLKQKPEGDKMLDECKAHLQEALQGTNSAGHPALNKEIDQENKDWIEFIKKCTDVQENLKQFFSKFTELEGKVEELTNWIKNQELQVKDQSLKNTAESKLQHLNKLKGLEKEIQKKGKEFSKIVNESKNVERDSNLVGKVSKLSARYQTLRNLAKEAIGKYKNYSNQHKSFDENYVKFDNWLSGAEKEFKEHSDIVGDVGLLQERQKKLRELIDLKSKENTAFDQLLDDGEKLYAHTSPDGREILRQQLKALRSKWDTLGNEMQNAIEKLEDCLVQFSEFAFKQEELTNWLREVEKSMQQHTELKNSLQEKRAQLQNHRIIHQEILAHQSLVDGVCEKAKRLVDQTKDTSLNVYLQSIGQLFHDIVAQSQALLISLERNVENDSKFTEQCKECKDWLTEEKDKLQESSHTTGERPEIQKRSATLQTYRQNLPEGEKKIESMKNAFAAVAKSTAPKGIATAEKEVQDLVEGFQEHQNDIGKIRY